MRYAIYFVPKAGSLLACKSATWLQYDIADGQAITPTGDTPGALQRWISEPQRYGFHATIKAPFRLAEGCREADLIEALDRFCSQEPCITNVSLTLRQIEHFLALIPQEENRAINDLADRSVVELDRFRAPMSEGEREKRLLSPLSPRQTELMNQWGYPHVFDCFRFHMTLTGSLDPSGLASAEALLKNLLRDEDLTLDIRELALCVQPTIADPFRVLHRSVLGKQS